jgi:hypothetical protein
MSVQHLATTLTRSGDLFTVVGGLAGERPSLRPWTPLRRVEVEA